MPNRPYALEGNVQAHGEWIINLWQRTVGKHDKMYFAGDLTFRKSEDARRLLEQLPGEKYLAVGNHDGAIKAHSNYFRKIAQIMEITIKPSKWEELNGELRYNMRLHILLYEQDCLCGYSEIPLDAETTSSHIDHFVKRDYDHSKIFDWDNLVVSAIDEDYGGKYEDNTYKIKQNEYAQIFNPTKDDMGQYIEYLRDGRIAPRDGIQDAINDKILRNYIV